MPTFSTPGPVKAAIKLAAGEVTLIASDRDDTVVSVEPYKPDRDEDVKAAAEVDVSHTPAKGLRIRQANAWFHKYRLESNAGMVRVTVELPSASQVQGVLSLGTFRSQGSLGASEFTISSGQLQLGQIGGSLHARNSNGSILVQRADADVDAKTNVGNIVLGEVVRGTVDLETHVGEVEVGVHPGSSANVSVRSRLGRLRNSLPSQPSSTTETVTIRARTSLDDVIVKRA